MNDIAIARDAVRGILDALFSNELDHAVFLHRLESALKTATTLEAAIETALVAAKGSE